MPCPAHASPIHRTAKDSYDQSSRAGGSRTHAKSHRPAGNSSRSSSGPPCLAQSAWQYRMALSVPSSNACPPLLVALLLTRSRLLLGARSLRTTSATSEGRVSDRLSRGRRVVQG